MSTTETEIELYDSWQNVTKGRVVVIKLDARGQKRHEIIGPGKTFHITPLERRMNQDLAANEDLDVFLNGTLQPVRLVGELSEEDAPLKDNPNHIGNDEMTKLFRSSIKTFGQRVSEISNPAALEALREIASAEETNATLKQVEIIEARMREVAPSLASTVEHADGLGPSSAPPSGIKAVTPR